MSMLVQSGSVCFPNRCERFCNVIGHRLHHISNISTITITITMIATTPTIVFLVIVIRTTWAFYFYSVGARAPSYVLEASPNCILI
jgi:hypothetical protein